MSTSKRIEDKAWLEGVRDDLDSRAEDWAVKPGEYDISKLQALGKYLDEILTELGVPPTPHACPKCGVLHSPSRDAS